jgi:hypothetical protein
MKFKCVRHLCNYYKIRMLWLSQNHNNYAVIHEHLKSLYDVHTYNPNVIINE